MSRRIAKDAPSVAVIGPAPPPVTGQSSYYLYLRELLGGGPVYIPLKTRNPRDGFRGFAAKIWNATYSLYLLARVRRLKSALVVLDSGLGLLIDIAIVIVCRIKGAKVLLSHHSFRYIDRSSELMKILQVAAARDSVNLFLCASMGKKFAEQYGSRLDQIVINNSRRVDGEIGTSSPLPGRPFTIGYLSNISFEKGIREFFETFEALRGAGLALQALVAGPAVSEDVERYVQGKVDELPDVRWIGPVYGESKEKFLQSIDVLVFPTQYANEAQPNVLFEALKCGVLCVTVGRGCIYDDMEGSGSVVVAPGEPFVPRATEAIRALSEKHTGAEWANLTLLAKHRFSVLRSEALAAEADLLRILR